ncbi:MULTISPECIES: malonyl-CoA decarboxylase [Halocynthiibacter]|uniref:Malonyl-CoA decarboxylase n=1 Tax=Halocynthiibacter halioticoli TaxID=2986804 RepID=A0AAE3IZA9_9RHOB|nr:MULTISPECIES: malonyl-CoA decarboxylase [Halocynthiibacter]MCV6824838.1 malonyl-CoA decarboxylase [Halocynthiibacter halioticoli]MCW4057839.1 malonyl-CoA decarboxylase [Halocynthiibacter sp. SDUM655004]
MQRNKFLPDILTTLFDRRRSARNDNDPRDIRQLCLALLAEEGKVSGHKLAEIILARYRSLSDENKLAFFQFMNDELDINADQLVDLAKTYAETRATQDFERVTQAAAAGRRTLLGRLNQPNGATADLVSMRVDLLRLMKSHPELGRSDIDFSLLLRNWFNLGFLVLKQIDWMAPASLLDKIVAYEAVHEIDDLDDLRRRLSPPDRRCFAFFHPAMPDEPLIFVEVALSDHIPSSVDDVLSEGREPLLPEQATAAVFYSISNCQQGLKGISFGNLLIKQVVRQLSQELPQLTHFVTLSPIPRLNTWLNSQREDKLIGAKAAAVLDGNATDTDVRALAAHYLLDAKSSSGAPFDPVARFHLGNGAEVYDVHANADSSTNGRNQSSGAMVNYLYDLKRVERNHEEFALEGKIVATRAIKTLAKGPFKAKPQELTT